MGHENGGWMNEDQRASVGSGARPLTEEEKGGKPAGDWRVVDGAALIGKAKHDRLLSLHRRGRAGEAMSDAEMAEVAVLNDELANAVFRQMEGASGETRTKSEFEDLAEGIVAGFLVPACQYQPRAGEAFDHHEPWKHVRAAAGVIVGYALAMGTGGAVRRAQTATNACLRRLANERATLALAGSLHGDGRKMHAMIVGPKGLSKRVAECLLALGVGR